MGFHNKQIKRFVEYRHLNHSERNKNMLENGTILSNVKLTADYRIYSMTIRCPRIAKLAKSGQFVMIRCGDALTLRRPISICDIAGDTLRICYDVRGEGTDWLSERKVGEELDILGPVGRGFDISDTSRRVLLVGGGIGIYPLYSVAKRYGANATVVLGFRTAGLITMAEDFTSAGAALYIATDDGSAGEKGYAINIVNRLLENEKFDIVMTCGPKIMMKGVAEAALAKGIRTQVSMEERMGCGVGACLSCVCAAKDENGEPSKKRVCVDGPVFEAQEVDFNA